MYAVDDRGDRAKLRVHTKLRAPFGVLQALFGKPSKDIPEKSSTCWYLRAERGHAPLALSDTQDEDDPSFKLNVFRSLPAYDWHVWAPDAQVAETCCRWLSKQVIVAVKGVKTLSPEGKEKLNALLSSGVPIADAMKQVTMVAPPDTEKRFAWPILG